MGLQDVLEIIGILLAVVSIIVAIFTQSIRKWLVVQFTSIISYIRNYINNIWFRLWAFLCMYLLVLTLLFLAKALSFDQFLFQSLIFSITLLGGIFILYPIIIEITAIRKELEKTKHQVDLFNKLRQSELEEIQKSWKSFVEMLSNEPGFEIVGAFLTMSKPVLLENNTLVLGLPEVVLRASRGVDLESVAPIVKSHFGREYLLRPIVFDVELGTIER